MKSFTLKKATRLHSSIIVNRNDVPLIKFPLLEETGIVSHGFSTRLGGVSQGIFSSMNLSFTRGDDEHAVRENFDRIAKAIGFSVEDIVTSDQTHTNNIRIVTEADKGKGIVKNRDYQDIDGLITNIPGIPLAAFFADCVPLYFVDPVKKVIALSHSGWKGTVQKIGRVTVEAMTTTYGCNPKDILVSIGPSICQDCYEISEDVAVKFISSFPQEEIEKILRDKGNHKYQLDLWKANEFILLESGILKEHISLPDICTCCNKEFLFSHRGLEGKRGNLGAFLLLNR